MPSLQIRELPDDIYQLLSLRAQQEHRSLAQQALVDLRQALGADRVSRRRRVIEKIRMDLDDQDTSHLDDPEALIRADRER